MGRTIIGVIVAAALVAGLGSARAGPAAEAPVAKPNIVVVMSDDQTVESMRVMANVNALLAARGTTFANNFVSFPLCCPSRSTFLTGQYAHNHTVMGNAPPQGGYEKLARRTRTRCPTGCVPPATTPSTSAST